MADEHFTIDGAQSETWAGQKSFHRKGSDDDNAEAGRDCHGEKRTNEAHKPKPDPEARLYKKSRGQEATLNYWGHTVGETATV